MKALPLLFCVAICCFLVGCRTMAPTTPSLKDFESDGCTLAPGEEAPEAFDITEDYCYVHDFHYWRGGTAKERLESDRQLRDSIRSKGKPFLATSTFLAVRISGGPLLPTPWRWGYGWKNYPRFYRELTDEEKREVRSASVRPGSDRNLERLRRKADRS